MTLDEIVQTREILVKVHVEGRGRLARSWWDARWLPFLEDGYGDDVLL